MSSYSRFLDSDKLSKKFWAFRPVNPSCGLISLETGSKMWLVTSLVACAIYALRLAQLLFISQQMILSQTEKDRMKKLLSDPHTEIISWPEHPILEWFSKFIVCCLFGLYTWKLFRVIVAKDVPNLRTRFVIMCLINFIWFPMLYFEIMSWVDHLDLPRALNVPAVGLTMLFQVMGLMFTYSYITVLIDPQEDEGQGGNRAGFQDQGEVEEFNRV